MKILKKWPWAFAVGLIAISLAYATVTYVVRYTVAGTEVFRIENSGAVLSQGAITAVGPWKRGNTATGASVTMPTTTTGANFGAWVPVYNVGAAVTQGDVLIASNTGTGYVMLQPGTIDLTSIVGVAAESIAAAAKGWMVPLGGGYAIVKTTGTVNIGDPLVSTATAAGYAGADTTPTTGADFAKAMSAGTAAGGTVLAIMQ